tara:strand:- start:144 stop:326 length:183 start_codon:yes stop_codon:yes gene_type:complete
MSNIRERLKRHGLTLKDVANASGESESTISRVLNQALQSKIEFISEKLIQDRKNELVNAG